MLAATIILVACGVVTCAMRRTLVSRKARKKLVAENAEMSGENFYARQNAEAAAAQLAKAESPPPLPTDAKTPLISTNSNSDSVPTFTTYDSNRTTENAPGIPLNNGFSTAEKNGTFYDHSSRPLRPGYHGLQDEYDNPIPLAASTVEAGMMRSNSDRMLQNQYSGSSLGSQRNPPRGYGMSGQQPPRGRGYPPRGGYGRGGPGPYGDRGQGLPPNPRSGSIRGMRGGPAGVPPGNMGRGRGPPPGYPPNRDGPPRGYDQNAGMTRRPSDGAGYGLGRSNSNNYSRPYPSNVQNSSSSQPNLPNMGESGHAIEMMPQSSEPNLRVRNSDFGDPNRLSNNQSLPSPSSVYSNE